MASFNPYTGINGSSLSLSYPIKSLPLSLVVESESESESESEAEAEAEPELIAILLLTSSTSVSLPRDLLSCLFCPLFSLFSLPSLFRNSSALRMTSWNCASSAMSNWYLGCFLTFSSLFLSPPSPSVFVSVSESEFVSDSVFLFLLCLAVDE